MNSRIWFLFSASAIAGLAQDPAIITSKDMFSEIGLYYRAYGNVADVSTFDGDGNSRIKDPGGPHLWDFTDPPRDRIYRFDYVPVDEANHGEHFPEATFAERMTIEGEDEPLRWQFMRLLPSLGRRVYGWYDPASDPSAQVFSSPAIDFPALIRYNDSWTTPAVTFDMILDLGIPFHTRITISSRFKADAFGLLDLPNLGFGDALRVNEVATVMVFSDFLEPGQFQKIDEYKQRNYYWLRLDHGIAAQMILREFRGEGDPPEHTDTALEFVVMFETNKKPTNPCPVASPVSNLVIRKDPTRVLLRWSKAECTSSYIVQSTANPGDPDSWRDLAHITQDFYLDLVGGRDVIRFYRVRSLTPKDEFHLD